MFNEKTEKYAKQFSFLQLDSPEGKRIIERLLRDGVEDLIYHERQIKLPDNIGEDIYWYDVIHSEAVEKNDQYRNAMTLVVAAFARLRSLINNAGDYPSFAKKDLMTFLDQLEKRVYPYFHKSSGISNKQKLFLEFLTGLVYVEAAGTSAFEVAAHILPDDDEKKDLFTRVRDVFQSAPSGVLAGLSAKVDVFNKTSVLLNKKLDSSSYFKKVHEWFQVEPEALAVAQRLVSLRYADDNVDTIGPAQMLHWRGLGGDAGVLKSIPQLEKISELAIKFHDGFGNKMKIFIEMLNNVDETHCSETAKHLLRMFQREGKYYIHDFATGPVATAAIKIAEEIHLYDPRSEVEATVSDISVSELYQRRDSLVESTQGLDNLIIRNLDLLNLDQNHIEEKERGKYHAVSVKLGLHQIVGSKYGQGRFGRAVRYFNALLREGGIVSIAKAAGGVEMQYPLIPGNIADREGKVKELTRQGFIENWVVKFEENGDNRCYAILVPLYTKMKNWPGGDEKSEAVRKRLYSDEDSSMYGNNFYMQVRLTTYDYQRLAERAHQAGLFPMSDLYDIFTQNELYRRYEKYNVIKNLLEDQVDYLNGSDRL